MKKKFNVITILSLLGLIVASSITLGKVFAYFGAKSSASGAIEMGTLSIGGVTKGDGTSIDWDIPNLQPNQSFGGSYKVEVNSNINYYIRILFKASVTPQSGSTHINGTSCEDYVEDDTDILSISIDGNYSKSNIKTADGYTPYYRLTPTTVTASSTTTTTETFNIDLKVNDWVGCNYCHYYMKADVVVNMRVQVMQADYLENNGVGETVSSVSTMHSLWTSIMEPVEDVAEYTDLTFTVLSADDKTMSVKATNTSITTANIPAYVKKDGEVYTVTQIATNGFFNCKNLTLVTIPDTVTSIGSYAFLNCHGLTSITIPDGVTNIGNCAFSCSSLTSAKLPSAITAIPYRMFDGCSNLTSIDIPSGVTSIGYDAFYDCASLASISIPDTVTTIGGRAFGDCSALTSVTIPSSVTSIGGSVFYNCKSLTSITILSSVTSIGDNAFGGCSKLQYNTYDNAKYLGNSTNPYVVLVEPTSTSITSCTINSNCKIICGSAFSYCKSLTLIDIPSNVTRIGDYVFGNCTSLTVINVDNANTTYSSINGVLFDKNATKLIYCPQGKSGSYTIPNGVASIGDDAFSACSKLTSITIPNSVTSIGSYAFSGCSKLTSIVIPISVTNIGTHAFATNGYTAYSSILITYAGTVAEMNSIHDYITDQKTSAVCYKITCGDGTYTHYQYATCVWVETEIDCWDDKKKRRYKKRLKDLTYDDDIVVWDFDNGKFATAKALFITETKKATAYTLTTFSDGTTLKTIGADDSKRHRLFNVETGRFEYIGNKMKIGTKTFNADGKIVEVVDMKFIREEIEYRNVISEYHINVFANGILTSNRMSNLYPIKDMKYVKDNRVLNRQEDYPEIEERYFKGLRLAEQDVQTEKSPEDMKIGDIVEYVKMFKSLSIDRE